jgi:hypothetical protein
MCGGCDQRDIVQRGSQRVEYHGGQRRRVSRRQQRLDVGDQQHAGSALPGGGDSVVNPLGGVTGLQSSHARGG